MSGDQSNNNRQEPLREFLVLYDFTAERQGEMSVKKGNVVFAFESMYDSEEAGWVTAKNKTTGEVGWVPRDYIKKTDQVAPVSPSSSAKMSGSSRNQGHTANMINDPTLSSSTTSKALPTTTASLNFPASTSTLNMAASNRVEIRRLSDPRLMQHLLETVDRKASPNLSSSDPGVSEAASIPITISQADPLTPLPTTKSIDSNTVNSTETTTITTTTTTMTSEYPKSNAPRALSLIDSSASRDFSHLFEKHDMWLREVNARRQEHFHDLTTRMNELTNKLESSEAKTNEVIQRLTQLDALIDEERLKWKNKLAEEKKQAAENLTKLYL